MAIAQAKGFFEQQGIKVEMTRAEMSRYMSDFANEQLDMALVPLGNAIVIAGQNPQTRVVAVLDESEGADVLVANAKVKSVADLKDKRLGVKIGQFGELFVIEALKSQGLSVQDVRLIDTEAAQIPDALSVQTIEAGHTWEPYAAQATTQGNQVLLSSKETPGLISDVIATREDILSQRPEAVKAFIRAWFQAIEYWQANPTEANEMISALFEVDPASISLEGIKLTRLEDNLQTFIPGDTTRSLAYTTELYTDFFIRSGTVSSPIKADQLLNAAYLPTS
jgi:NitT/TauT family transport system substrate-binding protein